MTGFGSKARCSWPALFLNRQLSEQQLDPLVQRLVTSSQGAREVGLGRGMVVIWS
jgi:hypothetical protein